MLDITQIPASRVPVTDIPSGIMTREWYRFFYNIWQLLYSGTQYGTFHDETSQYAPAIQTPTAITFDKTDLSNGIYTGTPTSRIYVSRDGYYNIQFSAQIDSSSSAQGEMFIWLRVNNADVPYTSSKLAMKDVNSELVAAWNFVTRLKANDYFELMWATDTHNNMFFPAELPSSFAPGIPSVILTVTSLIGV